MSRAGAGRKAGAILALALSASGAACGASPEAGAGARKAEAVNRALNGAGGADYAAAVQAVRRAEPRPGAADAEVASLTLRGLADPGAIRRPPGTAESALAALEAAAARDPKRDAPIAEAVMRYGVRGPGEGPVLLAPRPAVADCWSRARTGAEPPGRCVALRRGG